MHAPAPSSVRDFVGASPIQREPIAQAVTAFAYQTPPDARVLDAGAGEAPYRPLFGHCEYLTQDWPSSVHGGATAADVIGDLHDLDLPDHEFDAVICTEVLEHVADPGRVCGELRRVLRPGGRLLVTVPFVGELHEEPHDHRRFTSYGIEETLAGAGFTDVSCAPLCGYYGTLAHVLRHAGLSTRPADGPQRAGGRAAAFALLCASGVLQRIAPAADRSLDQRHALPIGWICHALAGAAE